MPILRAILCTELPGCPGLVCPLRRRIFYDFHRQGRLTSLIESGQFFKDLGIDQTTFDPAVDRVMLCGSMEMIKDLAHICEAHGMIEGSNAEPGDFVLERAFVG